MFYGTVMADRKSVEKALKAVERHCGCNSSNCCNRFYIHINWKYCLISVHEENSPALDSYSENDEIPDSPRTVFGETTNGFWIGYFESCLEALGYSKLINDIHHKQTGQYLLIDDFCIPVSTKAAQAFRPVNL
jgi:hypothetical protein